MLDPFISVQDLTDYLGRNVNGDAGGTLAVQEACAVCRTVAEQQFTKGTTTTSYDGTGTDALLLTELPVLNAGTVVVNGGTITDYVLNGNGILLRGTAGVDPRPIWPAGRQNVSVTYEHGYATVDIPSDVKMVAISVASRLIVQGVASSERIGDVQIGYSVAATDLTNGELRILRKYRPTR